MFQIKVTLRGKSLSGGSFGTQLQFGLLTGTAWQNLLRQGGRSGMAFLAAHWVPLHRVFPYILLLLIWLLLCLLPHLTYEFADPAYAPDSIHLCLLGFSINSYNISLLLGIMVTNDLFIFYVDRNFGKGQSFPLITGQYMAHANYL